MHVWGKHISKLCRFKRMEGGDRAVNQWRSWRNKNVCQAKGIVLGEAVGQTEWMVEVKGVMLHEH